jgi:uncharacterized protein (TIGR02687 family)
MSNLVKIQESLKKAFQQDGARIVFWNDPEKEFLIDVDSLQLEGVTTLRLDQESNLQVKWRLEREEPNSKFLLYSPNEEPDFESDWLLDIRLYSRSFRADRASILLQELGLLQQSLKNHLADRRKFFDAKERFQRLKALVSPNDTAIDLDKKMMMVVAKADQPDLFHLVRTFFHGWLEPTSVDLDESPANWQSMEKLDLDQSFWEMVESTFGYQEDQPCLKNLLIRMLVTDFKHHYKDELPAGLKPLLLPEKGLQNAVVCLAHWRDSSTKGTSYDQLSAEVAQIVHLNNYLPKMMADALVDVQTFLAVEKRIASQLKDRILDSYESIQIDSIRSIVNQRQTGHWATNALADNVHAPRTAFHAVYDALLAAGEFLLLWQQHKARLTYSSPKELFKAYEDELYQFDQIYRHFCEAANIAESKGWDIAKALRPEMENHYAHGFLGSLSLAWGKFFEPADGLLSSWRLDQIPSQFRFYERNVGSWINSGDNRRAYVIISDAFRYEAAHELCGIINTKTRMEASLSSQLGVLPSYTALGMASLLPHRKLQYSGTDVLVDGVSSASGNRNAILEMVEGGAIKANELMAMKKDEGREFVKDKRVVYIYHDVVDSTGDDAKTEGKTFEAVHQAIQELTNLISHLTNNLNGTHIVVTADHGFLYTDSQPTEIDKSKLKEKPKGAVIAKKRYILGNSLEPQENAWKGKVRTTAGVDDETEFLIPKGTSLFHFVGGARFVHGGAMPQEICVPVLTIKQVRGKETKAKPVTVHVLGSQHRITTGTCRFNLLQMEPVGERLKPITLKVGIFEGGEAVSNIQTVKFDSETSNLEERKKWVTLTLTGKSFDKKKNYRLVLTEAESGIEQQSVEVIIDRAVQDDF